MSWGVCYMYYHCPECGTTFKYAVDMIPVFGDAFGRCPQCSSMGVFEKDGARTLDDCDYTEVED